MFQFVDVPTVLWSVALAVLVVGVALSTVVRARPTRSITHVLHDVEHPESRS